MGKLNLYYVMPNLSLNAVAGPSLSLSSKDLTPEIQPKIPYCRA